MPDRPAALDALIRDAEAAAAEQTDPLAILVILMRMMIRSNADPYLLNGALRGHLHDDHAAHTGGEAGIGLTSGDARAKRVLVCKNPQHVPRHTMRKVLGVVQPGNRTSA